MVKKLATKYGYRAKIVEPVMDGERMASSTYIRELRRAGETEHVTRLLKIGEEGDQ